MFDEKDYVLEYVELDVRVYTGPETGYTQNIQLEGDSEPRPDFVQAVYFELKGGSWFFVFKGGYLCVVNENRIRYVKGKIRSNITAKAQNEKVVAVNEGADDLSEDVHSSEDKPKRRGRPPKAKAE